MPAQSTSDFKSPVKKLASFFEKSRDKWKAKYFAKRDQAILLANQVRAVEKSREYWRTIAQDAKRELDELKQAEKKNESLQVIQRVPSPVPSARLHNHEYSVKAILQSVQLYLAGAISFHACSRVIEILKPELSAFDKVPSNNTIQSWVLRMGLYQLSRAKEIADDWVIILDHTCQLGSQKCLIVLGIRRCHWAELKRPLVLQDLSVLMIEVVRSSTGLLVHEQLLEVQTRVGTIAAILSDQGSDLTSGSKLFVNAQVEAEPQDHASHLFDADGLARPGRTKPLVLKDFSHASSHLLKARLEADPRWREFLSHCGTTQPKVKQTVWGALAPPTQKVKGRYMNIGEMIRWGARMLRLLDGSAGTLPEGIDRSMLQQKYGWIENYVESLEQWLEIDILREQSLQVVRDLGYSNKTVDAIQSGQASYRNYESSRQMAAELLELAREQCQGIPSGVSYPGSSEVIESLIAKNKELQGQQSRGGFTKMLLTIGTSVSEISEKVLVESLLAVREIDVRQWAKNALGTTLASLRRNALPGTKGA